MRAARLSSIVISAICIAVSTIIWLGIEFQGPFKGTDFLQSTLFIAAIDLFYIGILWIPHRLKDSKYAAVSVWTGLALSLVPLILLFIIFYEMSGVIC